jgi:putative ABC transport system permease protein
LVATRLAEATGIDMAQALTIVHSLASDDFQKALNNAIDELVIEYYARFGGGTTDRNRKIAAALAQYLQGVSDTDIVFYYNTHMPSGVSPESFNDVIKKLGVKTPESPDFIYMYPIDFESKDSLSNMISEYNQNVGDEDKIEYMDIAAMLMSSVSDIITAISVILIGFISISLVVSSIMIGIITYISVLERTKEIGILRAVGASKKDISRVFNAETVIVGLLAGIVGIATTLLLCIPINAIARAVTGIAALTASLPWYGYLLILLSVGLTLIAGLIPARMAARKDPVEALRAE